MASLIRWVYYAPNTYKQLKVAEYTKARKPLPAGLDPLAALTLTKLMFKFDRHVCGLFTRAEFLQRVSLPVLLLKFVLLPAPLLLLPGSLGRQCRQVRTPDRNRSIGWAARPARSRPP